MKTPARARADLFNKMVEQDGYLSLADYIEAANSCGKDVIWFIQTTKFNDEARKASLADKSTLQGGLGQGPC